VLLDLSSRSVVNHAHSSTPASWSGGTSLIVVVRSQRLKLPCLSTKRSGSLIVFTSVIAAAGYVVAAGFCVVAAGEVFSPLKPCQCWSPFIQSPLDALVQCQSCDVFSKHSTVIMS
jgi:hypothetical protein